jgi:hypothetical protein
MEKIKRGKLPKAHTAIPLLSNTYGNIFLLGLIIPGPSKYIQTFFRVSFKGLVNSTVTIMSEPTIAAPWTYKTSQWRTQPISHNENHSAFLSP